MNAKEQARFDQQYRQMGQSLKLQGKRPKICKQIDQMLNGFSLSWEDAA